MSDAAPFLPDQSPAQAQALIERLQAQVQRLEEAECLQHALFAIADMAASEVDMQRLLRGMHQIIGGLMYAENFFIALYDSLRQTLRFIYFADAMDGALYRPDQEIAVAHMENSITVALIQQARAVRGPSRSVAQALGLDPQRAVGSPSVDFVGVPMRRDGQVLGALVVQSYQPGKSYTEADQAVLAFVAGNVLDAVLRKQGQEALERRVLERTQALAHANAQLQEQVKERERAAHLQATLYQIAALSQAQGSAVDFYRSVHQAVGGLITAENFYITLLSEDGTQLLFPYGVDMDGDAFLPRAPGRGLSEYVIRQGSTVLADRPLIDTLIARGEVDDTLAGPNTLAWLGAPLLGPEGVVGVVAVQSHRQDLAYTPQDAELLTFVSYQIASSLQRRQQAEALQKLNAELEQRVQERTHELRQEIAAREQVQEQLQHQVMHDTLTGLPNRRNIRERLQRALGRLQRQTSGGFALFYLDVDKFKQINDGAGHLVGDAVLREVAARLADCVRKPDVAARLSGDEFAVLLDDCPDPALACRVAQRIEERMRAPVLVDGQEPLVVSVSIGIAMAQAQHTSVDALLHEADTALYQAKQAGRQRYMVFGAGAPAAPQDAPPP